MQAQIFQQYVSESASELILVGEDFESPTERQRGRRMQERDKNAKRNRASRRDSAGTKSRRNL